MCRAGGVHLHRVPRLAHKLGEQLGVAVELGGAQARELLVARAGEGAVAWGGGAGGPARRPRREQLLRGWGRLLRLWRSRALQKTK
jgi:hypothetical protein